ncbi:hypothetical protein GY45DRAFT_533846 [Cubamyces sp. BRFM 1775]|nr:hypothetical protein GY45DRAFT_533846 [Cubamyces sp. BRFM 1775]
MVLPPRPPNICATAWEGVVASQYGLLCAVLNERRDTQDRKYWVGGYGYTISLVTWVKCAQSGCVWCGFLANHFLPNSREWLNQRLMDKWRIQVGRPGTRRNQIEIIIKGHHETFELSTTEGDPAAAWIKDRMIISHVGRPYTLALANACIEECVRGHPECQAITSYPIGSAPLPTRLIDCSHPDHLRIVETDFGMRGTYIALSYVWGEDQPYRLTESNLPRYEIRIDNATLPQTILDAIHVT